MKTSKGSVGSLVRFGALVAMLLAHIPLGAAVTFTFTFNYNDSAGAGFNHATEGAARRAALELAGQQFATAFSSYTANITVDVDGTASGGTLMAAGSAFGTFSQGFGNVEVVRNKVINGTDLNGAAADASVSVNFGQSWQLDLGTTVGATEFDWYSTSYHELAHVFGFSSAIFTDASGGNASDAYGTTGANPGAWAAFDQFLTDSAGNSVFAGNDLNEATYESLLTGGDSPSNGLFFNSTSLGARIGLYSPTTFEEGSSGSHIDDNNATYTGWMMLAATGTGPSARTFSDTELAIFRDIGYTNITQIVPEPSSCLMMTLGVVALAIRRRRH